MTIVKEVKPDKLCYDCFNTEHPGQMPKTVTWARECTRCHTPTPPLEQLIKVDRS